MKKSQLERAIESVESEIAVLQAVKAKLLLQRADAPKRRRPVPAAVALMAAKDEKAG